MVSFRYSSNSSEMDGRPQCSCRDVEHFHSRTLRRKYVTNCYEISLQPHKLQIYTSYKISYVKANLTLVPDNHLNAKLFNDLYCAHLSCKF